MLSERQACILAIVATLQPCTSTRIVAALSDESEVSPATVKRDLACLLRENLLAKTGTGRSTRYRLSDGYETLRLIDMNEYFLKEQDERSVHAAFEWSIIEEVLPRVDLFSAGELELLNSLHAGFREKVTARNPTALGKDLERLAIDLSWKSSQIEGNTYTLLETERLIKESKSADGKTREEALMLLNHKEALDFLLQNREALDPVTPQGVKDVHYKLVVGLDTETDIRSFRVGITGTNYQPLDYFYDIDRALKEACELINSKPCVFEKALLALALISYIQPFADGNKRTARLVCNGILLAAGYCPMSFRTVDSLVFKQAILLFYEQQNLSNLKQIFMEQYAFATSTYF